MKKVLVAVLFVIGMVAGYSLRPKSGVVHAQVSSPSYVCNFGPGGVNSASPCAQYVIEVVPARLGGGVIIYQVQGTPFDVSNASAQAASIASGSVGSGASVQVFQPNSTVNTVTISVANP